MPPKFVPAYRFHKARRCAVVTLAGRDHYLGTFNSPESREKYHRLVAEHLARRCEPPPPESDHALLTVTELIARYWRFAKRYYRKDGNPTSEVHAIKFALRFARRPYGSTPATEFSPKKLKAVREAMVRHELTRDVKGTDPDTGAATTTRKVVRTGLGRRSINKLVGRVKRMFAWAVEEELVPVAVHAALARVKGLRKGKTEARETPRVRPVPDEHVQKILAVVPPLVRAMVELQWLSGCRPQDVVQLRPCDLDTSGAVWEYRPRRFKTEHHGDGAPDLDRVVYLGPKAQAVLTPLLPADPAAYVFSPERSEAERRAAKTLPPTSNAPHRRRGSRPKAPLRPHYPVSSYRQAVRRGCVRAGVPVWVPNQLRHSRLTEIRKLYGLEASRVCGGHREVGVTQIYAEQDRSLAQQVMAAVG